MFLINANKNTLEVRERKRKKYIFYKISKIKIDDDCIFFFFFFCIKRNRIKTIKEISMILFAI